MIVNDAVSLSLVIFVAHFGHTKHRPRLIAIGGVFAGVGAILMGLPQFIYATPNFNDGTSDDHYGNEIAQNESDHLCYHSNFTNTISCDDGKQGVANSLLHQVAFLIIGRGFIGVANSVMFPLAITFIDDNVPATSTGMYVGMYLGDTS